MFIDEITLHMKAGKGGDGVERWRHEKGKEYGGPSGGNGGRGGDIYALAVRDIDILSAYRNNKEFEAKDGEALADAIIRLAKDEHARVKFGEAARRVAFSEYSIKDNIAGMENLYLKLSNPGR